MENGICYKGVGGWMKHILKIILIIPIICCSIFVFGEEDDISMINAMDKLLDVTSVMREEKKLIPDKRFYLDSLESGQIITIYENPGLTWKRCNENEKKHNTKYVDCEPIGWLDRNSFVYTLKDDSNRVITKALKETQPEYVYDEETQRSYAIPKEKNVSYSKIYFRYVRKIKKDGAEKVYKNEGIGWIPTEYLSPELHKPFYKSGVLDPSLTNKPIVEPKQKPSIIDSNKPVINTYPPVKVKPSRNKDKPTVVPSKPAQPPVVVPPLPEDRGSQMTQDTPPAPSVGSTPRTSDISTMANYLDAVEYIVGLLKPRLGVCIKPNFKDLNSPNYKNNYNPFDRLVLPNLNALDTTFVDHINSNSNQLFLKSKVLLEDVVAIDALARTMYAEMGICYRHGLHYPMAVARIALNRTFAEPKTFKNYTSEVPHAPDKSPLSKILTTPSQFNAWIPKEMVRIEGRDQKTTAFKQVLCPPVSGDKEFYTGSAPKTQDQEIWMNSLRIATEAVLFSEDFMLRTRNIEGDHYTSGLVATRWHGMRKVVPAPTIEGRKISLEQCMQVWVKR